MVKLTEDTKHPLRSKSLGGAVIMALAATANHYDIRIGDPEGIINAVILLIGLVLSIVGRLTATKKIGLK